MPRRSRGLGLVPGRERAVLVTDAEQRGCWEKGGDRFVFGCVHTRDPTECGTDGAGAGGQGPRCRMKRCTPGSGSHGR